MYCEKITERIDFSKYTGSKILIKWLDGTYSLGVCNTFDWTDQHLNLRVFDFSKIENLFLLS